MKTINLTKILLGIAALAFIACSESSSSGTNPDPNPDPGLNPGINPNPDPNAGIGGNPNTGLEIVEQDGFFTDLRDGRIYKTAIIGAQTWMAENLKFQPSDGESYCFDAREANCEQIGRLYIWKTAKNVCPIGYHLPSDAEWEELLNFIAADNRTGTANKAGIYLKSTTGWVTGAPGVAAGRDKYGFNAIPAGEYSSWFNGMDGMRASFWSSTEYTRDQAIFYHLSYSSNELGRQKNLKFVAYPIRCIKG